jgi:hypothetical protein
MPGKRRHGRFQCVLLLLLLLWLASSEGETQNEPRGLGSGGDLGVRPPTGEIAWAAMVTTEVHKPYHENTMGHYSAYCLLLLLLLLQLLLASPA